MAYSQICIMIYIMLNCDGLLIQATFFQFVLFRRITIIIIDFYHYLIIDDKARVSNTATSNN